jgi:copper chaperone CopZ
MTNEVLRRPLAPGVKDAGGIASFLQAIDGVEAVAVSALTGSVTVVYEPEQVDAAAILEVLRARGLVVAAKQRPADEAEVVTQPSFRLRAGKMAHAVLYLTFEQVMERPVKAVLAAML